VPLLSILYKERYGAHPCTYNHTNQSNKKATCHTGVRYYAHRGLNQYKSSSLAFTIRFSLRRRPPTIVLGNLVMSYQLSSIDIHLCSHSVLQQDQINASSAALIVTGTPLLIVHYKNAYYLLELHGPITRKSS
jgi:hypothetical protein